MNVPELALLFAIALGVLLVLGIMKVPAWVRALDLRKAVPFLGLYVAACITLVIWLAPDPQSPQLRASGWPSLSETCGRMCDPYIKVGKLALACTADLLGPSFSCPSMFDPAQQADVVYMEHDALLSRLGLLKRARLLLEFRQSDQTLWGRTPDEYRTRALEGSAVFYLLLARFAVSILKSRFFRRHDV